MNETKQVELQEDEKVLNDVLRVYRNVHNALDIVTNSIVQLDSLGLTDEDIERINNCKGQKVDELFQLVGSIESFIENQEMIFNGLV